MKLKTFHSTELGQIYNLDCREVIAELPYNYLDLVITSPPYNVDIPYDVYKDNLDITKYIDFISEVFFRLYAKMKSGGRLAINVLYEANMKENRGGRIFFAAMIWQILEEIGYRWGGMVDLKEISPEKSKLTAWGSWLSPTAPYLYNPKECVIICYKDKWKREINGNGFFHEKNKKEFIELTSGSWSYRPQTQKLTEANYSIDIPLKALKILGCQNDIVYDPFLGSGTTGLACEKMGVNWIASEISRSYCEIAENALTMFSKGDIVFQDFVSRESKQNKRTITNSILDQF